MHDVETVEHLLFVCQNFNNIRKSFNNIRKSLVSKLTFRYNCNLIFHPLNLILAIIIISVLNPCTFISILFTRLTIYY